MAYDNQNIFAKILRAEAPSFKIYEDDKTYAMMDIMPQTKGHLLILTKEEAETLLDLSVEGAQACMATAKKIAPALLEVTKADGFILSQFNNEIAGQTVHHVHFHLVPRYIGQKVERHGRVKGDMDEIAELGRQIAAAIQ
ncbi:HIT family protein [Advenella sp. S44]|uniref:HIT family protein n=1 Tax=Advenella sp. S44 TaxID=1982755 RepID=UPI000C2A5109|nr:HIT domain-containing protein [Advenella sp. S44]PJX27879.1 HIT family protein [Advenella sp. S44]